MNSQAFKETLSDYLIDSKTRKVVLIPMYYKKPKLFAVITQEVDNSKKEIIFIGDSEGALKASDWQSSHQLIDLFDVAWSQHNIYYTPEVLYRDDQSILSDIQEHTIDALPFTHDAMLKHFR
jgi:hypothetical protein